MVRALFKRLRIDFSRSQESTEEQAKAILKVVGTLKEKGYRKVGISYSANHQQALAIEQAYQRGEWRTGIDGGNQAAVMACAESLLALPEYQGLQGVFCIVPITTCEFAGGTGAVKDLWLDHELKQLELFLKAPDHALLGWQNQLTVEKQSAPFAVGGGISAQLTGEQNKRIQSTLLRLEERFGVED